MAQVHNNIFVRGLSGAVGDQFVIRRTRSGKTIIANKPVFDENRAFTRPQLAQQSAFKRASAYAKVAKVQGVYVEKAKLNNSIAYNMAISDWFRAPEVLEIDTRDYSGQTEQSIRVRAEDDTKVARVLVTIHHEGTLLEQGEARQSESDEVLWTYATTHALPSSGAVTVEAKAYDLPGNEGVLACPLR